MAEQQSLLRDFRDRLDARAVLEHYGAENCRDQPGPDGTTEIVHSCLIDRVEPHHNNGDRNPSACLNVEKKLYVCYTLGWGGNLLRLIQKMENADGLADIDLGGMLTGSAKKPDDLRAEILRLMDRSSPDAVELPRYSETILAPWMQSHPYMRDRGISQEAHQILSLGYDPKINRVVFPHFFDGKLVGWQTRAIPPGHGWPGTTVQTPKYKNTPGFPKAETLYAYDLAHRNRRVVVVESPMSVAKAYSLGVGNIVATFGAKVTDQQIDLLRNFPEVVVWFDDDFAGRAGERNLVTNLYRHTTVSAVIPEKGRDLADNDDATAIRRTLMGGKPATMLMADYARLERFRS
jgi:DNA primase